jgi:hypothetical protein
MPMPVTAAMVCDAISEADALGRQGQALSGDAAHRDSTKADRCWRNIGSPWSR